MLTWKCFPYLVSKKENCGVIYLLQAIFGIMYFEQMGDKKMWFVLNALIGFAGSVIGGFCGVAVCTQIYITPQKKAVNTISQTREQSCVFENSFANAVTIQGHFPIPYPPTAFLITLHHHSAHILGIKRNLDEYADFRFGGQYRSSRHALSTIPDF